MTGIVEFLTARITEDERLLKLMLADVADADVWVDADAAAKREIVRQYESVGDALERCVYLMALPYKSYHPDFDPSWTVGEAKDD